MNNYISNEIIKVFNYSKKLLEFGIKNNKPSYYDNECYLIENKWYKELEKAIRDCENTKNKDRKQKVSLPQQFPEFINDINKAIELLKSNNEPKLISKNVLLSIYNNKNLKNANLVKHISGFNNLIIIFKEKENNNGLLLFGPLDEKKDKTENIVFSFKLKNKKNEKNDQLFSEILKIKNSLENILLDNLVKKNKIEKYSILTKNEEISHRTEEYIDNSDDNILKIFISIFYFEKSLSLDINKIFSKIQNFNLINPDWYIEFKNNYNYGKIYELLRIFEKNNKIDYSNLDQNINDILLYSKNNIKIDKKELSENLMNSDSIKPPLLKKNNINYYDKCHIVPFEIMNSINEYILENKIAVEPKEIFSSQENDIYIIDSAQIFFGKIVDKLLFTTEYIFSYDSINILNEEKEIIHSTPIIEYIQQKKCNQNDSSLQDLWDNESSKKIGKFITLNSNSKIEPKTIAKEDSSIKSGIIEIKVNSNIKRN